jgi:phospholipid-translocating ATPase
MFFSSDGYRTLCFGLKKWPKQRFDEWKERMGQAVLAQEEEKILELNVELESGIDLIGASALEDQLQDKVPETIDDFTKAGIKVWMLTGDKLETAENIGFSCKMFNTSTKLIRLANIEPSEMEKRLRDLGEKMKRSPSVTATKPTLNNGYIKGLMTDDELDRYGECIDEHCRQRV